MFKKVIRDRRLWYITIAVFILLIAVFDRNNLLEAWRLKRDIKELEVQKEYYEQKIVEDSTILENLKDNEFLEEYAREEYHFKRAGETLYLIEE